MNLFPEKINLADRDLPLQQEIRQDFRRNLHLFISAASINTQKAMLRALKVYHAFCHREGDIMFPLEENTLLQFIRERGETDVLGRSVEADVAMLKMMDSIALNVKYSPMSDNRAISLQLAALKKSDTRKTKATAIHFQTIEQWYSENIGRRDDPDFLRNNALFRLAYDGMLRVSEMHNIKIEDIDAKSSTLFIPFSKTDQAGEGEYLYLRPETLDAVTRWIQCSGKSKGEALFWSFYKGGKLKQPLSTRGILKIVKDEFLFIDGASSHSFRIGACEDLAAHNISMTQIMLSGRWKDPKMPTYYSKKIQASRSGMAELAKIQNPWHSMRGEEGT